MIEWIIAKVPKEVLNNIGLDKGEIYSENSHTIIHKHDLERYKKMEKLLKEMTDRVNGELSRRD